MRRIILAVVICSLYACTDESAPAPAKEPPNILLIIGDDMGVETLASYGLSDNPPKTATLDRLAAEGVRFTNVWSQPVCSPTRATMLTGRYSFRTGVGRPVGEGEMRGHFPDIPARPAAASFEPARVRRPGLLGDNRGLLPEEFTLPAAIKAKGELGYTTAAIGKWHLADKFNGWAEHPNRVGFDHFSGLILGWPESYFSWNKVVDGEIRGATGYTPNDKVEDALVWIAAQGDRPWFLWFAFNLPHAPLHVPPANLLQSDHSNLDSNAEFSSNSVQHFNALIEAMDSEIEKLLSSMTPEDRDNTVVIFIGDNGTSSATVSAPFRRGAAKGSVYQGGVHVPLIVSGPGVARGATSAAMVNSTDLFSTIIEMAGIQVDEVMPASVTIDSVSFLPQLSDPGATSSREWLYADYFNDNFAGVETGNYAFRNERYKLVRIEGSEEFYDLAVDPYEHNDLLKKALTEPEQAEYQAMQKNVFDLRNSE